MKPQYCAVKYNFKYNIQFDLLQNVIKHNVILLSRKS